MTEDEKRKLEAYLFAIFLITGLLFIMYWIIKFIMGVL